MCRMARVHTVFPSLSSLICTAAVISILCPALSRGAEADLERASFRPHWAPQAQFAGYYTALAKGFYRDVGIDLEIRPGGPGVSVINNVASGKETFGTEWLIGGLTFASKGAPLVNIAQMVQTGGLMLVAFKQSGIQSPKDMDGRSVGIWPGPFSIAPTLLFEQLGIHPHIINQLFTMDDFIHRKMDVASAMIYNEYHSILEAGIQPEELNTFFFRDYDLNFPEDGIYAHAETVRKNPALCRAFVQASIRGWVYAFDHPEEALEIVMQAVTEARTGTSRRHQQTMLEEIRKMLLYRVSPDKIGELDRKDFDFVQGVLQKYKLITKPVQFNDFYRPMYVSEQ